MTRHDRGYLRFAGVLFSLSVFCASGCGSSDRPPPPPSGTLVLSVRPATPRIVLQTPAVMTLTFTNNTDRTLLFDESDLYLEQTLFFRLSPRDSAERMRDLLNGHRDTIPPFQTPSPSNRIILLPGKQYSWTFDSFLKWIAFLRDDDGREDAERLYLRAGVRIRVEEIVDGEAREVDRGMVSEPVEVGIDK